MNELNNIIIDINKNNINVNISKINNEIIIFLDKIFIKHGIKPNSLEKIKINDDDFDAIYKFNTWYNRALEFSHGDNRDYIGFLNIQNDIIKNILPSLDNEFINIKDSNFIQNLLFIMTNGKIGTKYLYQNSLDLL